MTFVFLEIVIPLMLAFLLGLLVGFFVWRWRRRLLGASEWNALTSAADKARADHAAAEAANSEIKNEHSVLASKLKSAAGEANRLQAKVERLSVRISELEAGEPT